MNLRKYLIKKWKLTSLVLLLIILGEFLTVFWGFSTSKLVTYISIRDFESFKLWIIIMIADTFLWVIQIYFMKVYFQKLIQEINIDIREDVTDRLFYSRYEDFSSKDIGSYISYLTNDIEIINDYGLYVLYIIISQISAIIFCILATVYFHYSLILTILILTIIIFYGPKLFKNRVQVEMENVSESNELLVNKLTDVFQGYDDLLMMNQDEYMLW